MSSFSPYLFGLKATGLSVLFIFSKNQLLASLILSLLLSKKIIILIDKESIGHFYSHLL